MGAENSPFSWYQDICNFHDDGGVAKPSALEIISV